HVAGAAADMPCELLKDLLAARIRGPLEHGPRREHGAGRAEAALDPVLLVERGLHWREVPRLPERLDRRHRRSLNRDQRRQARPSRLAVYQDGAGTTASLLAAGLRARDPELFPQRVQQRVQWRRRERALAPVDGQLHRTPFTTRGLRAPGRREPAAPGAGSWPRRGRRPVGRRRRAPSVRRLRTTPPRRALARPRPRAPRAAPRRRSQPEFRL